MLTIVNLCLLIISAYIIGTQRAESGKDVGFRTLALVMLGAFAFTKCAFDNNNVVDYHVIAQIVSGVSFIGAGLIFKDKGVHNLTTAVLVWTMVAVAILFALNKTPLALLFVLIIWIIVTLKKKDYGNI